MAAKKESAVLMLWVKNEKSEMAISGSPTATSALTVASIRISRSSTSKNFKVEKMNHQWALRGSKRTSSDPSMQKHHLIQ